MKSKAMFPLHPVCCSLPLLYILAHAKELPQHSKFQTSLAYGGPKDERGPSFHYFFHNSTAIQFIPCLLHKSQLASFNIFKAIPCGSI